MLKQQIYSRMHLTYKNNYLKKRKSAPHPCFQAVCHTGSNVEQYNFCVQLQQISRCNV